MFVVLASLLSGPEQGAATARGCSGAPCTGTGWVRPHAGTPTGCNLRSAVLQMTGAWSTNGSHWTVADIYLRAGVGCAVDLPTASKKVNSKGEARCKPAHAKTCHGGSEAVRPL